MKLYETIHQHDGITDYSRHTSLSAAKKWKQRHQDEQPDNSDILVTTSRGANHSPA